MLQTSEPYIRIGRHSELNNLLEISIGSLRKLRCWRVKDICGSLKEGRFVNDKVIEMTENEFIHYQSRMIGHVESVTIEEARECVGEDQELTNTTFRRSRRARKRVNFDEFMCYDDWPGELRLVLINAHPTLMDCEFRSNAWDDVTQIEVLFLVSFFWREEIEGGNKW